MLLPLLLGLGLGGVKSLAVDQPMYKRKRQTAAEQNTFSPWTGKSYNYPDQPNPIDPILQYGMTGAMLGQGLDSYNAQNNYWDALAKKGWANEAWDSNPYVWHAPMVK